MLHVDFPQIEADFKKYAGVEIDCGPTPASIAATITPDEATRAQLLLLAHNAVRRPGGKAEEELYRLITEYALRPIGNNGPGDFTFLPGIWLEIKQGGARTKELAVMQTAMEIQRWNRRLLDADPEKDRPLSMAALFTLGLIESERHYGTRTTPSPESLEQSMRAMAATAKSLPDAPKVELAGKNFDVVNLYGAALKTAYIESSMKWRDARMGQRSSHGAGYETELQRLQEASQRLAVMHRDKASVYAPPHSLPFVEAHHDAIVQTLESKPPAKEDGIHVGVAGFFNLDLMAARRSSGAVLCDINPMQEALWELVAISLHWSENRQDFVNNIKDFLPAFSMPHSRFSASSEGQYDKEKIYKRLESELTRPASWLSSDESFVHIKHLFDEHKVGFLNIDLTDPARAKELRGVLDKKHLHIDSFYPSNVVHFLLAQKNYYNRDNTKAMENFTASVDALCDAGTQVIEASRAKEPAVDAATWSDKVVPEPVFETFLRTKADFMAKLGEWTQQSRQRPKGK